jgi:histidine triad (HIT) family protein
MSLTCLFCRIAKREIPADLLEETEDLVAFTDTNPQAPAHALIIPREHIASLSDVTDGHAALLGRAVALAPKLAKRLGLESGYRVVINSGAQAGQTVFHLHIHLLGGRKFRWPPG